MPDLTLAQLKEAYDAALEQIAAESFLIQGMDPEEYRLALRRGNNPGADPNAADLPGKLRMTLGQAQGFVDRYDIIDAYQNDATGFSAVALRDTATPNRVVLAVRSTEILNDRARDVGADFQIFTSGFAFDQILSAQDFLTRVQPQLQPGEKIDLVGYSLSGNVVRTLAAMYPTEINQTSSANVVFNATGLGEFSDPTGQNRPRSVVLLEMMSLYRQVEADPSNATDVPLLLLPLQLTAIAAPPIDRTDPNGNVYPSPRNDFAEAYVQNKYTTFYNDFGTTVAESSFAQYFGVALSGFDAAAVANSGSHPVPVGIPIEGQPVVAIPGVASRLEYLNTHSLTLIADSLRLQILFIEIDPNLSMDNIQTIFQASSASSANTLLGRAEKDTLENALDAVRKALLPIDPLVQPTPASEVAGGFGLISNRTIFHTNITTVENVLSPVVPGTYRIESLVNRPLVEVKGNALVEDAEGKGLAYRYALTELNPFTIIGPAYSQHNPNGELALFNPGTGTGSITVDYIQDRGLFLAEKIALNQSNRDIPLNPFALTHYHDNTTGYDIPSGLTIPPGIQREYIFGSDLAETISGGSLVANDHLYGGDGADTLLGNGGSDFLQGDEGNDTLNGGSGADRMLGGQGNDTYIVDNQGDSVTEGFNSGSDTVQSSVSFTFSTGDNLEDLTLTGTSDINGTGNELDNLIIGNNGVNRLKGLAGTDTLQGGIGDDVLIGGTGNNDLLEGGAGFDTYIYNNGDGIDQIEDSDATGKIVFNGGLLQGGISTDGGATYVSLDGAETYVLSGGHLIVNGVLTVNADFQSGQFGIQLDDLSNLPTNTGVPTGPFQSVSTGTNGNDSIIIGPGFPGPGDALFGLAGNDDLLGNFLGNDLLDGGEGDDFLIGYSGDDYLDGGAGNDYLDASDSKNVALVYDGHDILIGGAGDDLLYAGGFIEGIGEADYLDGGDGADYLWAGRGTDLLLGGEGDDILRGDNRPGGWPTTFVDFDGFFILVPGPAFFTTTGGDDFLDGGAGNDILVGDGGNDILSGGADNDQLFGDDFADDQAGYLVVPGDDILDGGAGDDLLAAGDGNDSLSGGIGIDTLFGDKGVDVLDGGDDADTMRGGDGADELFGGAGNDLLFGDGLNNQFVAGTVGGADFLEGGDGDDELQGGVGADQLSGGAGNDFLLGQDDDDALFGDDGDDELQGGDGIDLLGGDAGDDLLSGDAGDDTLFGGEGNDAIGGNDGIDFLYGGVGNDILEGGKGNDVLVGGAGYDIYNFSLGDGQDTITDTALAGEGNLIQFFSGITLGSLTFFQDQAQQTLTIQVAGGDSLRLLGFDPNTFSYVVNTLRFADGTLVALADQLPLPGGLIEGTDDSNSIHTGSTDDTIFAGAGNDSVDAGAGNDVLIGGTGNDVLTGSTGQDTYIFNTGDGMDIVSDGPGEGNRLVFGAGVSSNSVTLGRGTGDSLFVRTGVAGDAIGILGSLEGGDSPSIDALEFADGTTLSIEELFARGIAITGTAGADTLTGTSLIDRISGAAGDDVIVGGLSADILRGDEGSDQLFGGDGDDLLDGGADTDLLNGEAGQDTYVFGRGYGQDILQDSPVEQSGPNTIQLTSGISPDEVRLEARRSEDGVSVVLTINGTQDELSFLGASDPSLLPISQILFADGTSWGTAEILTLIEGLRVTAAPTGSFLEGTGFRDELLGAAGNDFLDGLGGADRMVGGAGDDLYRVEHPGDVVVEAVGEGLDTVYSLIDYTLPEHVEHLFLRTTDLPSTDPVHGEGNASANLLIGNFVNNVLIGGAGNDIFWGGFSIGSDYGPGNDDLYGDAGNDTYVVEGDFNGFDTVHDAALPGEGNRLQFGNSVRPDDVVFVQEGSTLRITNGGGEHGAILVDFDPSGMTGSLVAEIVAFSSGVEDVTGGYETRLLALMNPTLGTDNGEAVTGTSQADVIKAQGGDDVIEGGAGNDVLLGGTGNDTYVFNQGDGFDLIDEQPGAGDINTVQFGAGITQEMLRVFYSGTSSIGGLMVRVGTSGDGQHFLGVPSDDPTGPHAVETFHFADGTQLTFAQLFEHEVLVQGTERSDGELFGTFADDRMLGLSGSEALSSGDGNDTLIGGTGNDVLQGGEGSDTYVFNPGDGHDEIRDDPGEQGSFDVNRLQFGTGITASDLVLFDAGDGFTVNRIAIGTSGDGILLPNFIDYAPALTVAEFADGVTLDLYQLYAANRRTDNQTITGGAGNPVLIGGMGNDTILAGNGTTTLLGGAGHDTLIGGAEANLLMGGRGNDLLQGGDGHDTYLFNLGDGIDTIDDTSLVGEGNRIQFGAGIVRTDLTLTHDQTARTLTIQVSSSGADQLVLTNFDPANANGSLVAETLAFADGSTASLAALLGSPVNHAPMVATPLMDQTVPEDAPFTIQMPANTFADEDAGDLLTLSVSLTDGTALPAWLTFDAATHTFSGTPDDAQIGSVDLRVTATDQGTLSVSDTFTLTVTNVNEAPTVAVPLADQQSVEDVPFSLIVPAGTFADVDAGDTLIYSATLANGAALPTWLSFDPDRRTFSGTPLNGDVGTLTITVTAMDTGALGASDTFGLAVTSVNDAPTVAAPLADQQATQGTLFNLVVPTGTFADIDAGDSLIYSATLANGAALPTWLSFDPITRTFSGTPQGIDVGTLDVRVAATDTGNLSVADGFILTIAPSGGTVGNDILMGTSGNDLLDGLAGDDILQGLAGNDTILGGAGSDLLDGGTGTDTLAGGTGNDTYVVSTGDTVVEQANQGLDTVQSDVTWTLGANLEALTLTGTAAINGTGNALNNVLTGNSAANVLTGSAGNDVYVIGAGDTAVEGSNAGTDTVLSNVTTTLSANVELLGLTGTAAINGTGNALNNVLTGNNAANALDGRTGADILAGLDGNDTYLVDNTGDTVIELANNGTDLVQSSVTYTLAANVENLTLTGASAINGTGNAANNILIGNSVNNQLSGANGNDTLRGSLGNDTVNGGSGNDTFLFGRGDGQDLIQDSSGSADKMLFDAGINPLDLVISRQANDLRLSIHGSSDQITVQNWYVGTTNRTETIQAGNGQSLLSTQIDQLIQAMAEFSAGNNGMTWDQGIAAKPEEVQAVLAASWQ